MGAKFEKGQLVQAVRDTRSKYGHDFKKGDRARVSVPFYRHGDPDYTLGLRFATVTDPDSEVVTWYAEQDDFELVPEGPQWSDVEPGDKVTFRVRETGEEFTTAATQSGDPHRAAIMGLRLGLGLPSNRWEVVSIEKPRPPFPTAAHSVILAKVTNGDTRTLSLFHDHGDNPHGPVNVWMAQLVVGGGAYSDDDIVRFDVLYDAGKDA